MRRAKRSCTISIMHQHSQTDTHHKEHTSIYTKAWLITFYIALIELAGSYVSGSLALLADIGHVFTDTLIGLAPLSVAFLSYRTRANPKHIQIAAGLVTSILLLLIGGHVLEEARGAHSGDGHEVEGMWMFLFALLAAAGNFVQHRLLSRVSPAHRHVAHKGFHFHILADLTKNLLLPPLAIVIMLTGNEVLDVWAAQAIGTLVIIRAVMLAYESAKLWFSHEHLR